MKESNTAKYLKIAAFIILPNIGGWIGSFVTQSNLRPWYDSLVKPAGNPPNWVFGPVWTILYCSIGLASYLVYADLVESGNGFDKTAKLALALYVIQLALNWAWTPIFFGTHSLTWSAVEIVICLVAVIACGYVFGRINRVAGLLFVPYIAWGMYATYLNISFAVLNDDEPPTKTD